MRERLLSGSLVAFGLVLCLILTLLAFGLPVGASLRLMADGAFGDKYGIARTLVDLTPLALTGLGVTVAWRAGMYNIGGEGQYVVGGLAGAWAARVLMSEHVAGPVLTAAILLACVLGGASYGAFAGWLQVSRGVNVVIGTILLNFVAMQVLGWAVSGPLRQGGSTLPLTDEIPRSAMLFRPDRTTDAHAGIILAFLAAIFVGWFLFRSKTGFMLRFVGSSPRASRANRLPVGRIQVLAMAFSGGLCGLAGGIQYLAISGQLGTSFAQGWGFLAIPVALLGALHPGGVVLSAAYFGALMAGSVNLARFSEGGDTLVYVVQAAAVLALVGVRALAQTRRRRKALPA